MDEPSIKKDDRNEEREMSVVQPQGTFKRKDEDVTADIVTVKLNKEERAKLEEMKRVLEQEKDSTALKQLAAIGSKVLLGQEMAYVLETIFANKRKNKRLGINNFELEN